MLYSAETHTFHPLSAEYSICPICNFEERIPNDYPLEKVGTF